MELFFLLSSFNNQFKNSKETGFISVQLKIKISKEFFQYFNIIIIRIFVGRRNRNFIPFQFTFEQM